MCAFALRALVLPAEYGGFHLSFLQDLAERRDSEATRARLAALVTSSADAIIGATVAGTITDWNPAAERLFGYGAKEAVGRSIVTLVPPERVSTVEQILARVAAGEIVAGLETERRTKDGRQLDLSLTISPVQNDANQIIATAGIIRDVSAQKAAERALAISEERFRVAFEDAPIGMAIVHPGGTVLRVNRRSCEILGYSEDELLETTLLELTHPDDRQENAALMAAARAGEISTFEMEKRYIRKDGRIVWVLLCVSLVRDEAGHPRYFISQIQDITERKALAAELVVTHQRTREILARITDNFYALDREWRLTYLNEAAARVAGRRPEELIGHDFWQESSPAARSRLYPMFEQAMASGEPQAIEFRYMPNNTWYEVRAYPSADGLSVFFRDVTQSKHHDRELRGALEAAQAASRTQSQFVAMMSHELRTPLQAILGYADLLLSEQTGSLTAEQQGDIAIIRQGAERMAALIDQVLELSRIGSGTLGLSAEPIDLSKIVEQVRQDVAPQAAAKELALRIELSADLPSVLGDAMRVRQILLNLASNAVKFTDRGLVRIAANAAADRVDIVVRDTGIGIAPEALPHIFEEFRQGESGVSRRYEGAGLGLAIAQKLAQQMGGQLTVTSEQGVGSAFTLRLPAATAGTMKARRRRPRS